MFQELPASERPFSNLDDAEHGRLRTEADELFSVRRTIDSTGAGQRSVIYDPAVTTNPFVEGDEELDWDLLIRRIAAGPVHSFYRRGRVSWHASARRADRIGVGGSARLSAPGFGRPREGCAVPRSQEPSVYLRN